MMIWAMMINKSPEERSSSQAGHPGLGVVTGESRDRTASQLPGFPGLTMGPDFLALRLGQQAGLGFQKVQRPALA